MPTPAEYTIAKIHLTALTGGMPFSITASGDDGRTGTTNPSFDVIHEAVTGALAYDEVWLYAVNNTAANRTIYVHINPLSDFSTTYTAAKVSSSMISVELSASSGPYLVLPGIPVGNGNAVAAWAEGTTTNVPGATNGQINVFGFANQING